jgi:hypothetical protein
VDDDRHSRGERDHVALFAEIGPAMAPRAAVRWHGRLETEAPMLTLPESALALAALIALCHGDRKALELSRRLVRRVRPTVVPRMWAGAAG